MNIKPTILLVDDNEEILSFLEEELQDQYLLLKAENGGRGLELLKHESVQLIVCDIIMPEMNGYEFCKIIKTELEFSHIPIILLTAKNTMQSKIKGLELGADAYIEKPFSPAHLQAQISNLLSNRNKIKDYFASSPLVHIRSMAYSKADETFLELLNEVIDKNMFNTELDSEMIARLMTMSRATLYRKIKAISNLTPNELIHITRLKKAAELLASGSHKIYQIIEIVGYNSQSSFTRGFIKQFALTPTEYVNQKETEKKLAR